jgi:hypothetical protein
MWGNKMTRKRRSVEETIRLYAIKNHNGCIEWHGAQTKGRDNFFGAGPILVNGFSLSKS